jgi:hypothetical protein
LILSTVPTWAGLFSLNLAINLLPGWLVQNSVGIILALNELDFTEGFNAEKN